MVVDALRSDFVYANSSNFAFTQSLIRSGAAVPFTGHASAPTITMPRVKAITTGSVPSFVDLVLNFAESDTSSTLEGQDSWLAQLKAKRSGTLVMYGDDTWLRLFPGFFHRADGTTSFFVSDFTEVDRNVTRHIPAELQNDDWSAMTLHFLGLDHIGHKTGPRGPNMPAKQAEMDGVVREIYTAMEQHEHLRSCLLVLLGDHGMNEGGNHGASSPGETSTALTFISPKFKAAFEGQVSPVPDNHDYAYYDTVEQSDIVPTLAALLGFPVPRNNLGVIVPRLLELWTIPKDQYDLLYENAEQIFHIAEATFPTAFHGETPLDDCTGPALSDAQILACLWGQISLTHEHSRDEMRYSDAMGDIRLFLIKAQELLRGTASNYDLSAMQLGIALSALALALCLPSFLRHVMAAGLDGIALVGVMLMYAVTMFATSYVEEEHEFWYWVLGGWLTLQYHKAGRYQCDGRLSGSSAVAIGLVLSGIIRRWKQTGQKYAGDPDLLSEVITCHPWLLWILVVSTYAVFCRSLSQKAATWMEGRQAALLPVLVSISAFSFKVAFTAADAPELLQTVGILQPLVAFTSQYPLVSQGRVIFLGLGHLLACSIYYESPWQDRQHFRSFLEAFHDILSLFLITQTRTIYVPLFMLFAVELRLLQHAPRRQIGNVVVMSLLFQYASFFAFGGTNSIATVDLSNAYNGVSGYSVVAVGILTFLSNWAAPIWWSVAMWRLVHAEDVEPDGPRHLVSALTAFASVHTLAVMLACTILREHLFIWTVFSPKYLYTAAWVVGHHIGVTMLLLAGCLSTREAEKVDKGNKFSGPPRGGTT